MRLTDWDERYLKGEYSPEEPHQLLSTALRRLKPGRALDVACGVGRHAIFLAGAGWAVTAVDSSRVGLEVARKRAQIRSVKIETVEADLERHEFSIAPGGYDLICIFYYLQRDLFPPLKNGLRPGGTLVAAIHMNDDQVAEQRMNPDYLLAAGELRSYFNDWKIEFYREGRWDGPEHNHCDAEIIACKPEPDS